MLKLITLASIVAASAFLGQAEAKVSQTLKRNLTYRVKSNVTYLPDPLREEKGDLYLPKDNTQKHPAMVVIHGGGFTKNDKADSREKTTARILVKNGIVAFSINYQLWEYTGDLTFPTNYQDCMNAVKFLRKNADLYNIDPERIGILGASAGGNLASMVALTDNFDDGGYPDVSSKVKVLVDMYGNVDLTTHRDYVPIFNTTRVQNPEIYRRYSPYTYVHSMAPPTLLIHSNNDPTVNKVQSERFQAALNANGVHTKLVLVESNVHSIKLV